MACILRIYGEELDVERLIGAHSLPIDRFWKKGEAQRVTKRVHTTSGFNLVASEADLEAIDAQVQDAIGFLEANAINIQSVVSFPGVQAATLDFAVGVQQGYITQYSHLPARLVQLAAQAGLSIEISHYLCTQETDPG